jgi:hypothetical protein
LNDAQRRWWLDRLQEYREAERAGEAAQAEWTMRERRYFEQEVFGKGKAHLRNMTVTVPAHSPKEYCRLVVARELAEVPRRLREGTFTDWSSKGRPEKFRCFQSVDQNGQESAGYIAMRAWTPAELLSFDEKRLCHVPWPPEDIGRSYSLEEACFGLTILHDADGSFGRIVPMDCALYEALGASFWVRLVEIADSVTDAWAATVEYQFERIHIALRGQASAAGGSTGRSRRARRPESDAGKDERLKAHWEAARNQGTSKAEFVRQHRTTRHELDCALGRCRKRRGQRAPRTASRGRK